MIWYMIVWFIMFKLKFEVYIENLSFREYIFNSLFFFKILLDNFI